MARPTEVKGLGPRSQVSNAGTALLAARLADVRKHEGRLKPRPARDAVHDTRVSTRRLRAAIDLFGRRKLRQYEERVKALQDALGEVRDLQLQIQWLQSEAKGRQNALRSIIAEQRRRLATVARQLLRHISRWRGETAPSLLKAIASVRSNGRLGGNRMRRRLDKKLARVIPQLEAFDDSTDAKTIHRLRIALKKLRYDVELLQAAFPAYAGLGLSVLAPLQGELGAVHDKDVRLELLAKSAARASKRDRAEIESLLSEVLSSRNQDVEALSQKINWLVSEKIPDRLRTLLN